MPPVIRAPLVAALCLASALALGACGGGAHEAGLAWNEKPLRIAARVDAPGGDTLRRDAWEALTAHPPKRMLRIEPGEWGDSLWLLEFEDEAGAYTAFQELSPDAEGMARGVTLCGERVCFRRGRWIGALDAWSWKGGEWFDQALALPGAPAAGGSPVLFGSLLQQDRIAGSERILTGAFMGRAIEEPVYAVRAECRGDTAWVYAAPGLGLDFGGALARMPGWGHDSLTGVAKGLEVFSEVADLPPVVLRFSKRGMVGVEGCFDENLTSYWLQMQARGLKSLK